MDGRLLSRQHVRFATGTADSEGLLLYANGELILILARLDDWSHGKQRGRWIAKAAFGVCSDAGPGVFDTPETAEDWIRARLHLAHQR